MAETILDHREYSHRGRPILLSQVLQLLAEKQDHLSIHRRAQHPLAHNNTERMLDYKLCRIIQLN